MTEDLDVFDVVLDESDVLGLEEYQSDVRFIDTVCHPTKERRDATSELAQHGDVVIVVGGANSNKLAAGRNGGASHRARGDS